MEDLLENFISRSSWGVEHLANVSQGDLGVILLILAIVAFACAVWRAVSRDVLGTILCAAIGLVLLLVAL